MKGLKINYLVATKESLLCVYYTTASCWQYSLWVSGRKTIGKEEIYYTAEAAMSVGLELMKLRKNS